MTLVIIMILEMMIMVLMMMIMVLVMIIMVLIIMIMALMILKRCIPGFPVTNKKKHQTPPESFVCEHLFVKSLLTVGKISRCARSKLRMSD